MEQLLICPKCQNSYHTADLFCRACGYKLNKKTLSTSLSKQLSVYLMSLLLPPFGIIPAIKYLRQDDSKSKQIGIIAVAITIVSLIISIWLFTSFMNKFNNVLSGQPSGYEDLSF